jgi:hypothetical protein
MDFSRKLEETFPGISAMDDVTAFWSLMETLGRSGCNPQSFMDYMLILAEMRGFEIRNTFKLHKSGASIFEVVKGDFLLLSFSSEYRQPASVN